MPKHTTNHEPPETFRPLMWTKPRGVRLIRLGGALIAAGVLIGLILLLVGAFGINARTGMFFLVGIASVAFGLALLFVGIVGWLTLPFRDGLCRRCGYDLTGNVSGTCPECGTEVEP